MEGLNIIEKYNIDYYISSSGKFKTLEKTKNAIKSTKLVLISYCEDSKTYTAFLNEKGGPIICNTNIEILKDKFKEALLYGFLIESFISFIPDDKLKKHFS